MKRFALTLLMTILAVSAWGQTPLSVRIERPSPGTLMGRAIATWDAREATVSNYAFGVWVMSRQMGVLYSSSDGAGGFENEGQSLWRYDIRTGARRKLVTEYFVINQVVPVVTRTGRTVLLVKMTDGGLGAPHVAIVDPIRGEVWRHRLARFVGLSSGRVVVGLYRVSDIESGRRTAPYGRLYLDLDTILRRRANPYWPVAEPGVGSRITGSVLYRERIALPPYAVVDVRLIDATHAGTPRTLARRTMRTNERQVPIPFSLAYNPSIISSEGIYLIDAHISIVGRNRFVVEQPQPVITRGAASRDIEVLLKSVQ